MLLLAGPSFGMPPLNKIQADNLAAAEILIGQVGKITPEPASLPGATGKGPVWERFSLRLSHVVKSRQGLQPGGQVEVRFLREPLTPINSGLVPVQVAAGDLVIVYANPVPGDPNLLTPVCAGFSVVRLQPFPPKDQVVPFPYPPK